VGVEKELRRKNVGRRRLIAFQSLEDGDGFGDVRRPQHLGAGAAHQQHGQQQLQWIHFNDVDAVCSLLVCRFL